MKKLRKEKAKNPQFKRANFYLLLMGIFSNFMNLRAVYIHLGWFQISITNLIIVLSMLLLFGVALVLPFPGNKRGGGRK